MCIGMLYSNPNAALIVGSYDMKSVLSKKHPTVSMRIFAVDELEQGRLSGTKFALVWDTEAVSSMALRSYNTGHRRGTQEERAAQTVNKKLDANTMKALADALGKIGEMYDANILIVPKP
jgi:hypothetical protein